VKKIENVENGIKKRAVGRSCLLSERARESLPRGSGYRSMCLCLAEILAIFRARTDSFFRLRKGMYRLSVGIRQANRTAAT
jgi:hypothetical protein